MYSLRREDDVATILGSPASSHCNLLRATSRQVLLDIVYSCAFRTMRMHKMIRRSNHLDVSFHKTYRAPAKEWKAYGSGQKYRWSLAKVESLSSSAIGPLEWTASLHQEGASPHRDHKAIHVDESAKNAGGQIRSSLDDAKYALIPAKSWVTGGKVQWFHWSHDNKSWQCFIRLKVPNIESCFMTNISLDRLMRGMQGLASKLYRDP